MFLLLCFRGTDCVINLEEKGSTKIYAQVDVDTYPGPAVQAVTDSSRCDDNELHDSKTNQIQWYYNNISRYFVLRTKDGHHLGLGFADRSDSFDLNVALQVKSTILKQSFEMLSDNCWKCEISLFKIVKLLIFIGRCDLISRIILNRCVSKLNLKGKKMSLGNNWIWPSRKEKRLRSDNGKHILLMFDIKINSNHNIR